MGERVEQWRTQFEEIVDGGDRAAVVFRITVRGRGGLEIDRQDAMVVTVRDGRAVRVDYYNSRQRALEAVGLSE